MKKIIFPIFAIFLLSFAVVKAELKMPFYQAIKTCEKYEQTKPITRSNETFNIQITLDKAKGNKCIYKEKISQNKEYQMLTCEFEQYQLDHISKTMGEHVKKYNSYITKEPIFEAKLTSNGEIFQTYLANPEICKITYSKKK